MTQSGPSPDRPNTAVKNGLTELHEKVKNDPDLNDSQRSGYLKLIESLMSAG